MKKTEMLNAHLLKGMLSRGAMKKIKGGYVALDDGEGSCQAKGKECGSSLKCCKGLTCPADGEGIFYCK